MTIPVIMEVLRRDYHKRSIGHLIKRDVLPEMGEGDEIVAIAVDDEVVVPGKVSEVLADARFLEAGKVVVWTMSKVFMLVTECEGNWGCVTFEWAYRNPPVVG